MAEADDFDKASPLPGVGQRLRQARDAAGLSLDDLSARTRVGERQLTALEESRFGDLASRTYAIGFARAYARNVGLDERQIAADVRAEMDRIVDVERPRPVTFDPGDPARVPGSRLAWLSALGLVALAAAVFVLWRSFLAPAVPLQDLVPQATETARAVVSAPPSAAAMPASVAAGPVIFTATEPGIWVKFYDAAGTQLLQKQLAQGESYSVPASAVGPKLWTARPDALQITVGGRPVPRLGAKPIRMKDVPVDAAALLKRATAAPAGAAALPPPSSPTPSPVARPAT